VSSNFLPVFCSLGWGSADDCQNAWRKLAVTYGLSEKQLTYRLDQNQGYFGAITYRQNEQGGLSLFIRKRANAEYTRVELAKTYYPYKAFLGEQWRLGDKNFRFVNVGSHQVSEDAHFLEFAFKSAHKIDPYKSVEIIMTGNRAKAISILDGFQKATESKIFNVYKKRKKGYISGQELHNLALFDDRLATDYDILAVLRDPKKDILALSREEYKKQLLMTVRLARYTTHNPHFPPAVNQMQDHATEIHPYKFLPSIYRLEKPIEAKSVLHALEKQKGKRIAEITRFVKFTSEPQPQLMAAMLEKLFNITKDPKDPIDILLISVDSVTRRLFRRYRFKSLGQIKTSQNVESEYLMALDTHSDDFKKTYKELKAAAKEIRQSPVKNINTLEK